MSPLIVAFLDSTELSEDSSLASAGWDSLRAASHQGRLLLGASEVTVREVARQVEEKLQKANEDFSEHRRRLSAHRIDVPVVQLPSGSAEVDLRRRLRESGVAVLELPQIDHDTILSRDMAVMPPFSRNGRGYRDTLIWLTLVEWLSRLEAPDSTPYFVSANSSDFADGRANLHPRLMAELPAGVELQRLDRLAKLVEIVRTTAPPSAPDADARIAEIVVAAAEAVRGLLGFPFDDLPVEEPFPELPEVWDGEVVAIEPHEDDAEAELVDTIDGTQIWSVRVPAVMSVRGRGGHGDGLPPGWQLARPGAHADSQPSLHGELTCLVWVDVRTKEAGLPSEGEVTALILGT